MKNFALALVFAVSLCPSFGFAEETTPSTIPECIGSDKKAIPVDNAEVLNWKQTTPNQTLRRARIDGKVVKLFPDKNGHEHFSVQIGPNATDTIEVIYNVSFGEMSDVRVGMSVEACGDYITSIAQSGAYPPSPDGAILHWVHRSPRLNKHEHGYVVLDGVLFGFGKASAKH